MIDGGEGIRAALRATFGDRTLIQRCRQHKRRNVLDHLPEDQRTFIGRKLDRAWQEADSERAEQELRALAKPLQANHPGAAARLREGVEETLTVTRLGLSPSLLRTFKSTNPIESMISVAPDRDRQRQALVERGDDPALDSGRGAALEATLPPSTAVVVTVA